MPATRVVHRDPCSQPPGAGTSAVPWHPSPLSGASPGCRAGWRTGGEGRDLHAPSGSGFRLPQEFPQDPWELGTLVDVLVPVAEVRVEGDELNLEVSEASGWRSNTVELSAKLEGHDRVVLGM